MSWNGNDKIFRTYVKGIGDGKKPATGGKGKSHISNFDEVEKYRHFGAFLVPGYIDVSFDSKEMYKAFLRWLRTMSGGVLHYHRLRVATPTGNVTNATSSPEKT